MPRLILILEKAATGEVGNLKLNIFLLPKIQTH